MRYETLIENIVTSKLLGIECTIYQKMHDILRYYLRDKIRFGYVRIRDGNYIYHRTNKYVYIRRNSPMMRKLLALIKGNMNFFDKDIDEIIKGYINYIEPGSDVRFRTFYSSEIHELDMKVSLRLRL
jgi:hypothetical protein